LNQGSINNSEIQTAPNTRTQTLDGGSDEEERPFPPEYVSTVGIGGGDCGAKGAARWEERQDVSTVGIGGGDGGAKGAETAPCSGSRCEQTKTNGAACGFRAVRRAA
jgi:hypothetical protein